MHTCTCKGCFSHNTIHNVCLCVLLAEPHKQTGAHTSFMAESVVLSFVIELKYTRIETHTHKQTNTYAHSRSSVRHFEVSGESHIVPLG